jgi:Domain of unknown function (DUF4160)
VAIVEGIKVQFYSREHPPPHFHAVFAEFRAQIDIERLEIMNGSLPRAKLRTVIDWASTRRPALIAAWDAVRSHRDPEWIE